MSRKKRLLGEFRATTSVLGCIVGATSHRKLRSPNQPQNKNIARKTKHMTGYFHEEILDMVACINDRCL